MWKEPVHTAPTTPPAATSATTAGASSTRPISWPRAHYFLRLSAFQDRLLEWLESRMGWRKHVLNMAIGFTQEGLQDRAITRDLTWGIDLPPEANDLGEDKRIYVWFEAVIGYLLASKEWATRQGDPDAWRAWWEDVDAESYYFIGKDNVVFHTVIWPCQLMGYGGLNLPTDVPANQYVTFRGDKASASRGGRAPVRLVLGPPRAERHRPLRRPHHPTGQRRAGGDVGEPRQPGPQHGLEIP